MKIQIDTRFKTISVLDDVNCLELFTTLQKLFPNDEWKEFRLVKYTDTNWIPSPPIIVDDRWWRRHEPYPWITYMDNIDNINTTDKSIKGNIPENHSYYAAVEEGNVGQGSNDIFLLDVKL